MKKHILLPLALSGALTLSGCSGKELVMDIVGPRPDSEVVSLIAEADKDASLLGDSALGALRSQHAQQLRDEAARLCGVFEDGTLPKTCDIEKKVAEVPMTLELPDPESTAPAQLQYLVDHFSQLPEQSRPLIIAQAIDSMALAPDTALATDDLTLSAPTDIAAAERMLEEEYALQYALGTLSAFVSTETLPALEQQRDASRSRATRLLKILPQDSETTRAAAYAFEQHQPPTDLLSGETLFTQLIEQIRNQWRATATEASTPTWMQESVILATNIH